MIEMHHDTTQLTPRERRCQQDAERYHRRQQRTPVTHNGRRWTAAEESIVVRDDLGLVEMAWMIGRSYAAVASRRVVLRRRNLQADL